MTCSISSSCNSLFSSSRIVTSLLTLPRPLTKRLLSFRFIFGGGSIFFSKGFLNHEKNLQVQQKGSGSECCAFKDSCIIVRIHNRFRPIKAICNIGISLNLRYSTQYRVFEIKLTISKAKNSSKFRRKPYTRCCVLGMCALKEILLYHKMNKIAI